MMNEQIWPELPYESWAPTCETLHMLTQIVGKIKLKLCPFLNEYWHAGLDINARGLSTGPMPYNDKVIQMDFDFIEHRIYIISSLGLRRAIALKKQSVAEFYRDFFNLLNSIGVNVNINTTPSETSPAIPFEKDFEHATYDQDLVSRWWKIQIQCYKVFLEYRSTFFGKSSPILFYWGSFDMATTRYSGRPAPIPEGPRFYQLTEDQENINCGFWSGNIGPNGISYGELAFYAYAYPAPENYQHASIKPKAAYYDDQFKEFILRYNDVRNSEKPEKMILDFLNSTFEAASKMAHWDNSLNSSAAHRSSGSSTESDNRQ